MNESADLLLPPSVVFEKFVHGPGMNPSGHATIAVGGFWGLACRALRPQRIWFTPDDTGADMNVDDRRQRPYLDDWTNYLEIARIGFDGS